MNLVDDDKRVYEPYYRMIYYIDHNGVRDGYALLASAVSSMNVVWTAQYYEDMVKLEY